MNRCVAMTGSFVTEETDVYHLSRFTASCHAVRLSQVKHGTIVLGVDLVSIFILKSYCDIEIHRQGLTV